MQTNPNNYNSIDIDALEYKRYMASLSQDEADELRWETYDRNLRLVEAGYAIEQ
jgi:hypothetical protein